MCPHGRDVQPHVRAEFLFLTISHVLKSLKELSKLWNSQRGDCRGIRFKFCLLKWGWFIRKERTEVNILSTQTNVLLVVTVW